jgi:sugar phosphate isomerase/epimerase
MNNPLTDRRVFMKSAVATAGVGLAGIGGRSMANDSARKDNPAPMGKGAPNATKLSWRLGCQAWSFNDMTFYDAIDETAALGLHYIEAFPNQKVRPRRETKFNHELSHEDRREIKKRLSDNGVRLVNFGVGGYSKEIFDFAKDMGIETLVCEPKFEDFDALEKLCDNYLINVAIHDHPKPSKYWNPDTVVAHCQGRTRRIGACCDTGHWMRSDIKPVDALKKLEGRIISFHLKDLNEFGKGAHDVPWGTGRGDIKGILAEVQRQGVKPVFSVEYEYHYGKSVPEIAECVAYFNQACGELSQPS